MKGNRTHGLSRTSAYEAWGSMKERCDNPNKENYHRYGGRGIVYCERWKEFANFYADMGERPEGMTLDRIDCDGPYSPENCRWATWQQQFTNKSTNKFLTFNGITLCMNDWARKAKMKPGTFLARLASGWPLEKALTESVKNGRQTHCRKGHPYTKRVVKGKEYNFCPACAKPYFQARFQRQKKERHAKAKEQARNNGG